ncbi:ceramidase domain-containing protein [Polycladidibacter hongkongensis]|uniref:ceramidase domain-containing protein n=1 Tax=Polycladidibacter hongkongensis TaxID=1647556 RepID=UPI0008327DE6|nr:ceramidase domain-containing protein [Pseudovibrio hongkongensis]
MDLMQHIDAYCERTAFTFWNEPINAITNGAFALAALLLFLQWRRGDGRKAELLLISLIACIAVGSFLFHTVATTWAMLADTIPILLFMITYITLAMRSFLQWSWLRTATGLAVFIGAMAMSPPLLGPLVGTSAGYVPAALAIFVIAFLVPPQRTMVRHGLLVAGITFAVSVTFRSFDLKACAAVPIGLHFLWHLLNAIVLYVLTSTLMRFNRHK